MSVCEKIYKLLKINKMSANKLAEITGIPASTFSSMKRRNSNKMDANSLKKIAEALGVSPLYFFIDEPEGECLKLSEEETDFVLKMRFLDSYGQKALKCLLDCEVERVQNLVDVKIDVYADGEHISDTINVDIKELESALDEIE